MSSNHKFHIADQAQVVRRVESLSRRSDDIKCRIAPVLKGLWNTERTLESINNVDVFQTLKARFPNFSEVIDLYESSAIGLSRINHPFEAQPILLGGDPGLGKTYFVSELAKAIQFAFYEVSMATMTASFGLSGGSLQWSEGTTGFIANSLAASPVANPIILIDEIDKTSKDARYNPISPFYSLLEPHSAKRFKDEALEVEIDASKVIWFATANDIDHIPRPILSRMKLIHIRNPTKGEMVEVVKSVYQNVRGSKVYGSLLDEEIDPDVIDVMTTSSPREVRKAIDEAMMKAIRDDRSNLIMKDLTIEKVKGANRVGFI